MAQLKKFEAAVYNEEVRACLAIGETHKGVGEEWAEVHYVELLARNLDDAKAMAARRFPASKGFVIREVEEMKEFL
ncbi:MAG: hypothetical protein D6763_02010 [Alphaproteobacteria bacterium]|nr:MAG: hypothetical protein D6763_02010 [Alphaproteobacteria bacterium]